MIDVRTGLFLILERLQNYVTEVRSRSFSLESVQVAFPGDMLAAPVMTYAPAASTEPSVAPLNEEEVRTLLELPLDQQYAAFCALGDRAKEKERFERGLLDFRKFVHVEGVETIGIDWKGIALLAGTKYIEAVDRTGMWHELGHYIVTMTQAPSNYTIVNVTRQIGECAHPHAWQGRQFCMSKGNTEVKMAITDGVPSRAMQILMTALQMKPGEVTVNNPPSPIQDWPLKETKRRIGDVSVR